MAIGKLSYPELPDQVAMGIVPGMSTFRKFGMNPDVGTGSAEEVWPIGTPKVLPTAAAVGVCSSDSAEDDPDDGVDAGTGAHTIVVEGLDANYLEVAEEVTLNGTANVNTTTEFLRVNRAYCKIVGTNGVNVGNITITIGGNPQGYIEADEGQSHQLGFTVPGDKYILAKEYLIGVGRMAGTSDAHIEFQIRLYNENSNDNYESWRSIADDYIFNGENLTNTTSVILIPPKTDVRCRINSTATTQCFAEVGGYYVGADLLSRM